MLSIILDEQANPGTNISWMCLMLLIAHLLSIFFSFLLNLIVWLCCEWQCSVPKKKKKGISPPLSARGGGTWYGPGQWNISESLDGMSEKALIFMSISFPFLCAWNENVLAEIPALLWTWRWGPHLKEGGTKIHKGAWVAGDIIEHPYQSSCLATLDFPLHQRK